MSISALIKATPSTISLWAVLILIILLSSKIFTRLSSRIKRRQKKTSITPELDSGLVLISRMTSTKKLPELTITGSFFKLEVFTS